ncbi:MAG: hypothetical protein PHU91_01320 [Candidatus Omnitrophica bacterium]|nr:hypothetical protein [Candidatus Omnitrophota bacterium]MDD5611279.1 hypothetical protein [Candidatus Omnitrophota bacterium]
MKKLLAIVVAMLFVFSLTAYAQPTTVYKAGSGDGKLDTVLKELNDRAHDNTERFITDMSKSFGVAKQNIENMVNKVKMTFADVFMTLKIADITKKSVDAVVGEYQKNKGKGWGVVAKRLGIKPGSKEFHALKNGANATLGKIKQEEKDKEKKNKEQKKSQDKK